MFLCSLEGSYLHQHRIDGKRNTDPDVISQRTKLIACLRELVREVYGIFPYDTQILALLGIV